MATAPAETNTRVSDRVALHLVDGHFGGMTLDELNEATTLARWNLDVGNLSKVLEERAKFVLSDISREAADEDSGVVGVGELVHWLRLAVVCHWSTSHRVHSHWSTWPALHAHRTTWPTLIALLVGLRSRSRDAHRAVTTVDSLHFGQSTILVLLIGEPDEAISTRHSRNRVGHDFGRLARGEAVLEQRDKNKLVHFWAEVANKDGVFRWAVLTAECAGVSERTQEEDSRIGDNVLPLLSQTATRCPIKLERTVGIWNHLSVQR